MIADVDAVFLDVGGVFQLPTSGPVQDVLKTFGITVDEAMLSRCHYAGMRAYDQGEGTERTLWSQYLHAYATTAGVSPDTRPEVVPALLGAFRQAPRWDTVVLESVEALQALAQTGLAIAIVSNSDGTVEERLRAQKTCQVGPGHGVSVRAVLDSHVVGAAKPDPRIFHLALERTAARPERVIHVGDSVRADVQGARAVGIRPLHLDPYGHCPGTDHPHLRTLRDLL